MPNEIVVVAGSNRSGTSWLANIINHDKSYNYYFEPLNRKECDLFGSFGWRQYLRSDNVDPKYVFPVLELLSQPLDNNWVNRYNSNPESDRVLIKLIRGNLLLHWLKQNFPGIKLVLILRHPIAMAVSKMKLNWSSNLDVFTSQDELVEDHLSAYMEFISTISSDFERHLVLWCIETMLPLNLLPRDQYHLVYYEHLCTHGEHEIDKLQEFLGHPAERNAYSVLRKPSELVRKDSAVNIGEDPVRSWEKHVTPAARRITQAILERFGVDHLYSAEVTSPLSG